MDYSMHVNPKSSQTPFSLTDLPQDILLHICSYVASFFCERSFYRLRAVSKRFYRLCDDPYVIRSLPPWMVRSIIYHGKYLQRPNFETCLSNQNPHAMCHQGLVEFFHHNQPTTAYQYWIQAINLGDESSRYMYGMILLCLGGANKEKAFHILSFLQKKVVDETMRSTRSFSSQFLSIVEVRGQSIILKELRNSYVRDKCGCSGQTILFLDMDPWNRGGWELCWADACYICFWHREFELLFT